MAGAGRAVFTYGVNSATSLAVVVGWVKDPTKKLRK